MREIDWKNWCDLMEIQDIRLEGLVRIGPNDALLVIDMQNDFLPGGKLPVAEGDTIIPGINLLLEKFRTKDTPIIFTQDWHPKDHLSFASIHEGKSPYDPIKGRGIGPILWPDHCVQGTEGANFAPRLNTVYATMILRKGHHQTIDSYSAFLENDKETETGLQSFLKSIGIDRVYLCGLALDYCVFYSALDARTFGFEVFYIIDLTKPVNSPENSVTDAISEMKEKGVFFVRSDQILDY